MNSGNYFRWRPLIRWEKTEKMDLYFCFLFMNEKKYFQPFCGLLNFFFLSDLNAAHRSSFSDAHTAVTFCINKNVCHMYIWLHDVNGVHIGVVVISSKNHTKIPFI